jgi:hypothetical protein
MKSHPRKQHLAVLLAIGMMAPAAFANSVQFNFGPIGAPSMTALFQDAGPNQVQLTIDAVALNGNNTLNTLCFNFNPGLDSKNLTFTQTGSVGGVSGTVTSGNDCFKVGGGSGKFDINFVFGPDFKTGDSVTYSITGIPNLSVNDFLYLETPSAGKVPGYAAGSIQQLSGLLIVQGTPEGNAVPDISSTLGLLALAMGSIALWARLPAGCRKHVNRSPV